MGRLNGASGGFRTALIQFLVVLASSASCSSAAFFDAAPPASRTSWSSGRRFRSGGGPTGASAAPRRSLALRSSSFQHPPRPARGGERPRHSPADGPRARRTARDDDDDAGRTVPSSQSSRGRSPNNRDPPAAPPRTTEPDATTSAGLDREHFFSQKSLQDPSFPGDDHFRALCRAAGIARPSKVQSLAWPPLASGASSIVADQTGSGKTLAYLLPGLHRVLLLPSSPANATMTTTTTTTDQPSPSATVENEKDSDEGRQLEEGGGRRRYGAPRMVVLTPTSELADQVKAVLDTISRNLDANHHKNYDRDKGPRTNHKFSSAVVTATGRYTTDIREQIRRLQRQRVDVLVSTPGRLATILRTRNHHLDLTAVQTLVLDEVDVLMQDDDSFGPQLRTVAAALGDMEQTQFVFCTATLPDSVVATIEREFPVGLRQIRGPGLHRVAINLKENLVDVSVPSSANRDSDACFDLKAGCLLDALRKNKCRRTLVFCNTVESCRDVENLLNRHDRSSKLYSVLPFHNALTPETRNRNLQAFVRGPRPDRPADERRSGPTDSVLVCTDRAARGVDFASAPVDHVVIFDFPKDPAEYVRRVGRTARAGRPGTCTVFAYGWQLPIARTVMGAKLSGSVASSVVDEDDAAAGASSHSNGKFRVGTRRDGRRKSGVRSDESIKGNIEKGTLWGD